MGVREALDRLADEIVADFKLCGIDLTGDREADMWATTRAINSRLSVTHRVGGDADSCSCAGCSATRFYMVARTAAANGRLQYARSCQRMGDAYYELHAACGDSHQGTYRDAERDAGLEAER